MQSQRRIATLLFVLTTLLGLAGVRNAAAQCQISVATDRADALYQVDDEVRFLVTVTENKQPVKNGQVTYVLTEDGAVQLAKGSVELGEKPVVISGKMSKPGFLQCEVAFAKDGKSVAALAGAGISPEKIQPSLPAPDDFDAYWKAQKDKLAKLPLNPKLAPVQNADPAIECFDVQVDCLGGAPVSGFFGRPKDAKPKSLPALLWVHGAGVASSALDNAITGAKHGMLSMDINAHGIPNGKPQMFYDDLRSGALDAYPKRGCENRETCYFRGMYLRLVRAMDFLCSQPQWDGKILIVTGHSQGGGQSLVAAGLDNRVTAIAAGVPAMCDHTGSAIGRISGWPKLVPNGSDGKPDPKVLEASRYFDAVNFAARTKADAIVSVGFIDRICPPTTNYAAYNQLQGKKEVIQEPLMGHAAPPHIYQAFWNWIEKEAKVAK